MPDLPIRPATIRDELHPTKEDPVLGTVYMQHCTAAGCGVYVGDVTEPPPTDFLCDDCLEVA